MKVVDFQHHYIPRPLAERYGWEPGKTTYAMRDGQRGAAIHDRIVDLDWQIRDMDTGSIDLGVLSCILVWDAPLADCRLVNDDFAGVQEQYHGRFAGLAHVPFRDGEAGLKEVERAVRELDLRGIAIPSQVMGKPLDAPELTEFYRLAQELDVVIFVHPTDVPTGYEWVRDHDMARIIGRELDLSVATTRLIMGGVLDAFPKLRFVIAHFGGGIAGFKDRLVIKGYRFGTLKRPFAEYFDQLLFDSAGFEGAEGALYAALTGMKPSQIVFATDYPQDFSGITTDTGKGPADMAAYVELFRQLPNRDEDKASMLGERAAELLKLKSHPHPHIPWA